MANSDRSRRIPSDSLPKSISERLRIRALASRMFPNGLTVQGGATDGPHYLAMIGYLGKFVGTPYERDVWEVYFNWSRISSDDQPLIDDAAGKEGLSPREYISRETLRELRRFVRAKGIADPEMAETESELRRLLLERLNPPASDGESQSTREAGPDSVAGFLGGVVLANALGIHTTRRDAFFRQLERHRMSLGDDCWHEVRDPRPNSPRFLYLADSPKLRELAADYKTPRLA